MIKEFCDICKVEIDNQNVLAVVSTPVKNYKVCKDCLNDLIQYIENRKNNFKLENKDMKEIIEINGKKFVRKEAGRVKHITLKEMLEEIIQCILEQKEIKDYYWKDGEEEFRRITEIDLLDRIRTSNDDFTEFEWELAEVVYIKWNKEESYDKDEELDIPVKSITKQLELGLCMECGKRKAKYLCDYITGKTFDLHGKGQTKESTCDKYLCEKCTNKLNKRDYCREHINQLKEELKEDKQC